LSHRPSLFRSWFGLLWSAAVTISASLQFPTGTTANLWDALGANRYLPISLPGIVKGLASLLRQTFGFVDDPLVYAGIAWGVMNRVRLSAVSARARRDYGSGVVGVIFKPQQFNPAVSLKSAFSREFLCPRDAFRWRLALEAARQALGGWIIPSSRPLGNVSRVCPSWSISTTPNRSRPVVRWPPGKKVGHCASSAIHRREAACLAPIVSAFTVSLSHPEMWGDPDSAPIQRQVRTDPT
jgi:hypothetical protein